MAVYRNGVHLQVVQNHVAKEVKSELVPVLIPLHNMVEMIVPVIWKNQNNAKLNIAQVNIDNKKK